MKETEAIAGQEKMEIPGIQQAEGWELIAKREIDILADYLGRFSMVNSQEDLVDICREIFDEKLPSEYTGLYMWSEKEQRLRMMISTGFSEEETREAERTAMDRHPGKVFRSGEAIIINDTESPDADWSKDSARSFRVRTRLAMPVKSFNRTVGVFIIASLQPYRFSELERSVFDVICRIAGFIYYRLDQLEKSEEQNRKLADLALIATKTSNNVIIADKEGKIEWVNEAFTNQTGYSLEESIGQTPGRLLNNSDSPEGQRAALRNAIQKGEHIKTEVTNRTKSGRQYTNEIDITPIRNEKGDLIKFISVQKDITERMRFLNELNESARQLQNVNSRLETIARFSGIGIWEWDLVNNTSFWSEIAFDVFGVEIEERQDYYDFWKSLIHPDDRDFAMAQAYSLIQGKERMVENSYRVIGANGDVRYIRGLTYMERDEQGNNLRMVGSVVNVTKDVLAAETLAVSEAKYREIFANNVAGVFRTTLNGEIIDVNKAFLDAFGYEKEELMELGLKEIYYSEEERNSYLEELRAKGRLENYFLRTRHKSGEAVDLLVNVQLVNPDNKNGYLEGTLINITEIRQAQRKIQSSEALFRGIFDTNLAGVFLKNANGIIVDGNMAARKILGIEDEWGGVKSRFSDYLTDSENWDKLKKNLFSGKNPGSFRLKIQSGDGSLKNTLLTCNLVELEQLGPCLLFTIIDVTETDRLHEELTVSERRYRDLFENSLEIIQSFGPDGQLIFCNRKWYETLEYSPEETSMLNLFDIISEKDKEHCMELFGRVIKGESIQNIDVTFIGKTGKAVELNGNVVPMMKDGKMISTHSFFRDVSIENRQRKQLESQRKFYERVLENLPAEISILDSDMRYLYSNPQNITGNIPRTSSIGKTLKERSIELGRLEKDVENRINNFLTAAKEGQVVTFEESLPAPDGSLKTILRRFYPVFGSDGKLDLMISVGTDVTELEDGRRQLVQNNEELRKVNHELDSFVYSVSHDLRAPIASVKGLLSLMNENEAGEDAKQTYLSMMGTVMDRMDDVIFEILEYSRNSRLEVKSERLDPEKMVRAAFETYRHLSSKPVHLQLSNPAHKAFYSDNRRLQSVINNIVSNAIKYSLKGEKDIELKVQIQTDSEQMMLVISDNGEGIKASYLPHIFDMFYRASNTSSGSGLGLYICREVLKKLDGTISVESQEGKGTSFTVIVPSKSPEQ
jgi:PAS domain S-box-containing protein